MLFFKNMFAFLWRYILGIIVAVLSGGILALIFKLTLITVQGPTMFSQVSDVVVFYVALSVSFFFLFRNYGIKRSSRSMKEFLLYAIVTVVLHIIIIVFVDSWSGIWFISTGTWTFVELMYTGGMIRLVESYTEIPRMYYYIALVIEDVCFIVFSLFGYCNGVHKTKTIFHYVPASDEIKVNIKYQDEFIEILNSHKCSYTVGKVWTTDGCYRETRKKVNNRKESGCICVDMECSAVAALADFREKEVFHFFYAADNLDNDEWDARSLANSANVLEKDRIALLAMELATKLM